MLTSFSRCLRQREEMWVLKWHDIFPTGYFPFNQTKPVSSLLPWLMAQVPLLKKEAVLRPGKRLTRPSPTLSSISMSCWSHFQNASWFWALLPHAKSSFPPGTTVICYVVLFPLIFIILWNCLVLTFLICFFICFHH